MGTCIDPEAGRRTSWVGVRRVVVAAIHAARGDPNIVP
jgi:hypothetical protein